MSPKEDLFATASLDDTARLWDLRSTDCAAVMRIPSSGFTPTVAFDPQGVVLAAVCAGQTKVRGSSDPYSPHVPALRAATRCPYEPHQPSPTKSIAIHPFVYRLHARCTTYARTRRVHSSPSRPRREHPRASPASSFRVMASSSSKRRPTPLHIPKYSCSMRIKGIGSGRSLAMTIRADCHSRPASAPTPNTSSPARKTATFGDGALAQATHYPCCQAILGL